jgi:Cys-tRNA(Pro)/Cys-tRNA(Cys) deacylase
MSGRGTPATLLLAKQRVAHVVHSYEPDPAAASYGEGAAAASASSRTGC